MPQTTAERRRYERDRKRRTRAAARAAGAPTGAAVNAAIAEATSFVLACVNIAVGEVPMLPVADVVLTAKAILIDRGGYNPRLSALALKKALDAREQHDWPSHIPTRAPEPAPCLRTA